MKTLPALIAFALFAFCLSANRSFTAEVTAEPPAVRIPPQSFEAKVLKVFAARDGEAIFRAYVVAWKEQEVIVSDPLARSDYKEGDPITVLVLNLPYPQGRESYRLLAFSVVPKAR
jgi:hypothetical protein